jgi:hypothetical protein
VRDKEPWHQFLRAHVEFWHFTTVPLQARRRLKIDTKRREANPAPKAKRIIGPKRFATIGPVKKSPLTDDSKRVDSTGA